MNFLMRTLLSVLVICLTAFAVFSTFQLRNILAEQKTGEENYKSLAEIQKNAAISSIEQQQKLAESIEKSAQESREQIEKLRSELINANTKLQETTEALSAVRSYILPQYDENAAREASQPLAFSHFRSEEWRHQRENIIKRILEAGIIWITFEGRATLDTPQIGGDILVDGVFLFGFETFNLENKKPNTVYVKAPGLAHLGGSALTVKGDKGLDQVILDGCLKWQETDKNPDFVAWRAFDETSIKGKQVEIAAGLVTKVQDKCDNRYLSYYENMLIAEKLHGLRATPVKDIIEGATVRFEPPSKPFGGIGLTFSYEEHDKVIRVENVMPDKPAHQAGIKPQDAIIKIDEYPVESINVDEIPDILRGEVGSKVVLTYIPQGKTKDDAITATLTRVNLSPKDFQSKKEGGAPQKTPPVKKK